ncbi:MAG: hypothetical protein IT443_11255 [Phycisphaeraceae bacterium]|nr:hypothetical protein [Phycisphaeraceae bacterium]
MKRNSLVSLVVLNVLLLGGLVMTILTAGQPVSAQTAGAVGRYGDYAMVAATPSTGSEQVVYIVNLRTSDMVALTYRSAKNELQVIDQRNLAQDAGSRPRR